MIGCSECLTGSEIQSRPDGDPGGLPAHPGQPEMFDSEQVSVDLEGFGRAICGGSKRG